MNKLVVFTRSLLTSLLPKSKEAQPTIDSYGQTTCSVPLEQIQLVMEWLFMSLLHAGYYGKSHLIWYDNSAPDPTLEQLVIRCIRRDEPTFLYRCGERAQPLPDGYYWRLMTEHPSTRIYQLEAR